MSTDTPSDDGHGGRWSRIQPYVQIARLDHWFKNVFMIPGVVVVLFDGHVAISPGLFWNLAVAVLATGLVASSNYVINELLDAPKDALHPVKRHRPVPSGRVRASVAYAEWLLLAALGLGIASTLGVPFLLTALAFWVMGCLYNLPPVRTKDKPYLDVLSESVNNPLRLLLGWYGTGTDIVPSLSLAMAFWMIGSFFMAVKRFAEYRHIGDPVVAAGYRSSFRWYDEERLLISIVYYAAAFGLFFGIFLIRYRIELLLSVPFLAGFVAMYIHLGYRPDSPVQYPERLYRHHAFVAYTCFCALLMTVLMFIDLPALDGLFPPTIETRYD
jgi:4-hydroxybenzoate polyprenyltransferase